MKSKPYTEITFKIKDGNELVYEYKICHAEDGSPISRYSFCSIKIELLNRGERGYSPTFELELPIDKTAHDLINAGVECQHCIGSYTQSPDFFIRDGNICAQIDRETLTVRQCYDVGDRITKKSIALESKINKALKPLLELTESVK